MATLMVASKKQMQKKYTDTPFILDAYMTMWIYSCDTAVKGLWLRFLAESQSAV